jgi:F-type H+-transporting ATPase subunit alpha
VGGAAQTQVIQQLCGGVRLALALFRELAAFAQFASDLDEATRKQLERGQRVTELMKQKQYAPLSVAQMTATLYAVEKGYIDKVDVAKILAWEEGLHQFLASSHKAVMDKINEKGDWNDAIEADLKAGLDAYVKQSAI